MKPIEITHFVEQSYEGKPSFVILMSDGKEYISNGCVFVENTPSNRSRLIDIHDCENELDALLKAPGISWEDLEDGSNLFYNCESLTEPADTPNLVNGSGMYSFCKYLTEPANTPKLVDGSWMYSGCESLKEPANTPELVDGSWMYAGCWSLTEPANTPKLVKGPGMYESCRFN